MTGRLALVGVAALLLATGCAAADDARPAGQRLTGSSPAVDFALHDQDGKLVSLASRHGRYVVLSFLYVRCIDVCPLIAANVAAVLRRLAPADERRVSALAVSVDPAGDTPTAVRSFLRRHRAPASFRYLIGSASELRPVWQEFNVLVEPRSQIRVAHDAPVFVLDPRGRPILVYAGNVTASALLADLERLLR